MMIARKFSLLRQLVWAATLATGFGTALVLCSWSGSAPRFKRPGGAGGGTGRLERISWSGPTARH